MALKVAKKLKCDTVSGYANDSNPFGDPNLNQKRRWWRLKHLLWCLLFVHDNMCIAVSISLRLESMRKPNSRIGRKEKEALDTELFCFSYFRTGLLLDFRFSHVCEFEVDELDEPYMVLRREVETPHLHAGLAVKDMEELWVDMNLHLSLDSETPNHKGYRKALLVVFDWELAEARKRDALDRARVHGKVPPAELLAEERRLHSSIEEDVENLLQGNLTVNRSGFSKGNLLPSVGFFVHYVACFISNSSCESRFWPYSPKLKLKEERVHEVEEDPGSFSPELLHDDENEEAIDPDKDTDETVVMLMSTVLMKQERKCAGKVMGDIVEGEAVSGSGAEVDLDSQVYWWHGKYRPRKPKYFNRVLTGYEWNKFHAGRPYEDIGFKIVNKDWSTHTRRFGREQVYNKRDTGEMKSTLFESHLLVLHLFGGISTRISCFEFQVPYTIPPWSAPPCHPFFIEVLKDGSIIDRFNLSTKGAFMFGRVDLCDFVLEHPTISRFHAVLQFKQSGEAYLYDLASMHGTSINKNQVKRKTYTDLHVGDVVRFGQSTRMYIFQGPSELMPPEGDLAKIRSAARIRGEARDREASLRRAKREASLADGISWGLSEDAIEEAEEDTEEITWQTYKGQLTERQEKTREKIIKRTEKIAHMKKEIDAVRAKDISQGGLTQGQQTQIARNEQRMSQILEELESLEETLNESIQESLGAHSGKRLGKKKGATEDEDEAVSDEDDFYDRTKKKPVCKTGENTSVETADTLLDKKDAIISEMEIKASLLLSEKNRRIPEVAQTSESGDALDAYMTGLSSQLVLDTTTQPQAEISSLQTELDRILYWLKIADPTEAGVISPVTEKQPVEKKKSSTTLQKPKDGPILEAGSSPSIITTQEPKPLKKQETDTGVSESSAAVYIATKPVWLGAMDDIKKEDSNPMEVPLDTNEPDQFIDYKDRMKALAKVSDSSMNLEMEIENAAPGLIIRKRKHVEKPTLPVEAAASTAADAVALLLKHKKGYLASDDLEEHGITETAAAHPKKEMKSRRVVGPERPKFLENDNPGYETWVPPEGQSGDGRTSLNERYGY
ncbi:hypothetical protein MKW98_013519 [Papaver atlanticum]|uniref:FHA domain-containing protein n=1 Tax=Papaver atlanticum TaxID=357466 RepID=A0AAD4SV82_9MAGN|nr:hypothetical protein MKW98_013519 [Papaver atlanticum]